MLHKNEATHFSIVVSDQKTQSRTILFKKGTIPKLLESEVDWNKIKNSKYLFIADTSELTRKTVDFARENGTEIFIDADFYSDALKEMIPKIDVFIGSEFVFDGLFPEHKEKGLEKLEEECKEISASGPKIVVFTFGEKGCVGYSKEGFLSFRRFLLML